MNKDETGAVSTENALKMAIEGCEQCLDDLQGWAAYASEYFQDKWDLEGEVKDHRDKIQSCKEALEEAEKQEWQSLNADEIDDLWDESSKDVSGSIRLGYTTKQHYFYVLIEQALKEKNKC